MALLLIILAAIQPLFIRWLDNHRIEEGDMHHETQRSDQQKMQAPAYYLLFHIQVLQDCGIEGFRILPHGKMAEIGHYNEC